MSRMSKQRKLLTLTILCIALVQMPHLALNPAIARMTEIFPERTLSEIQTAVALPNLISMFAAILSAFVIAKGLLSKKAAVITGLSFSIITGIAALFVHTQFWHVCLLSVLIGMGLGIFIPTTMSLLFDCFEEKERQLVAGYQTSFINIGGIIMVAVGGLLTTILWYGAYLVLLITIPVALLAFFAIPNAKSDSGQTDNKAQTKSKLPKQVFYYAGLIFVFMLVYNVCGSNISSHIVDSGIGNAATAGIISAVQMAGGVASGLVYSKLAAKLGDYVIFLAFLAIFIGYTILNIGHSSLPLAFIGVFVVGSSLSLMIPQSLVSVSKHVDPTNSSTATSIIACFAPGAGGFLSPVIFTNLTAVLGGDSTNYRFQFVAIVTLVIGVVYAINTMRLEKRARVEPLLAEGCVSAVLDDTDDKVAS